MQPPLTIVMYHYVRPIMGSRYPRIRGLELKDFEGQLDYIERHYQVVSMEQVLAAARGEAKLPKAPLLLTFDDGYLDHYAHVFPALKRRNMQGVFFPPVCAVRDRRMLDVNKIHFILASVDELTEVIAYAEQEATMAGQKSVAQYRAEFHTPSRFDTADTMYFKRMLQFALPGIVRERVVEALFRRFVSEDEQEFAESLYLSEDQLREMIGAGMSVGGHGTAHHWLNRLSVEEQTADIGDALEWLTQLGACRDHFVFCYPYGGYNAQTLALLKERHCAAAFTTKIELAQLGTETMLELRRLDTNDLPKQPDASIAAWTKKAKMEGAI